MATDDDDDDDDDVSVSVSVSAKECDSSHRLIQGACNELTVLAR